MISIRGCAAALFSVTAALALVAAGCGTAKDGAAKADQPKKGSDAKAVDLQEIDWCKEHGIPESICVQCDAALAADYKKKGDWCKEHRRPASQCFECDPGLKEKFAAEYRIKYGKEPPPMEDEGKVENGQNK
jgi:hypothetical protein